MGLFEQSWGRVEDALEIARVSAETIDRLRRPKAMLEVTLPVRMDDGSLEHFPAWRCLYDDLRGPGKGGIRFHHGVDPAEVKSLAFWMTFKTALLELPLGGGKGGVRVNARDLSHAELERLSRAYVRAIFDRIGPDRDVPAPDVATNAQVMAWMVDEYEELAGRKAPAAFTGKPLTRGGSRGRNQATSRGAHIALQRWMARQGRDPQGVRVAIQGFGNAGSHLARMLHESGYVVVAASDSRGGVYQEGGLPVEQLIETKLVQGRVDALEGVDEVSNEELLELDVDVLVPAALEGVIDEGNVSELRAQTILEVANGPISASSDASLAEAGIEVIPDILANAGGVTVSYFEWLQGRSGERWELERVRRRLEEAMGRQCEAVFGRASDDEVTLRQASYALALERLEG